MANSENVRRLASLSMVPKLASEVVGQIEGASSAKPQIQALTAIATADATDLATALVLVNACKAKINLITAALKA